MFNQKEILQWEQTLYQKKMQELYPYQKKFKCPRQEKLRDFRQPDNYVSFRKEMTSVRRDFNRNYRVKSNHLVRIEKYDKITKPKRTSGWISW